MPNPAKIWEAACEKNKAKNRVNTGQKVELPIPRHEFRVAPLMATNELTAYVRYDCRSAHR
jgi:hypothetical protein